MVFNQINRVLYIPLPLCIANRNLHSVLMFSETSVLVYFCYALKVQEYVLQKWSFFSVLMWNGPLTNTLITPHLSLKADLPVITFCVASALETI